MRVFSKYILFWFLVYMRRQTKQQCWLHCTSVSVLPCFSTAKMSQGHQNIVRCTILARSIRSSCHMLPMKLEESHFPSLVCVAICKPKPLRQQGNVALDSFGVEWLEASSSVGLGAWALLAESDGAPQPHQHAACPQGSCRSTSAVLEHRKGKVR